MFSRNNTVYWTPFPNPNSPEVEDEIWFEPERVIGKQRQERKNCSMDSNFLVCPGNNDYMKNVFVIRSPIDVTLDINTQHKTVTNCNLSPDVAANVLVIRSNPNIDKYLTVSLRFSYLFMSKEPIVLEELSPFFEHDFCNDFNIIPGEFNIGKWIRPIDIAFEVHTDVSRLEIKRGDPLCYLRFRAPDNGTVKLVRVERNDEIMSVARKTLNMKHMLPGKSLDENYGLMEKTVKKFWPRFGCPFKKW